ncbi:hypothetical protein SPRG_09399 [Saprolegnia parasitica CBS 223.65]|uniref:Aquaporin n=1 Tax=Saprolegnia parasitica (strain CBS 223.65) TaxID=695850 RepID=A0A067CFW9_SAPPC|nr:hypothetical protein SPRG_09399 [Saprolegnia parasitica CBS 223.65]KDO25456.1 hypothetical protein SPRG_09399 [Saprolegnia parasitica CBS 223.65]|eukprot:XP_012203882.1 hypothetical protein SPRG_09399 [Saprolegnia parasitica CBS 223.65]
MGLPKALSWLDAPRSFARLDGDAPPVTSSSLRRECLEAAFASFDLVEFGAGSVVQSTISAGALGNYTHITLMCGIAVMFGINVAGINVAGGRSRGHLNPAFTIVQLVGAILGALQAFDPHQSLETSGRLFASYPAATETLASAFFGEVDLRTAYVREEYVPPAARARDRPRSAGPGGDPSPTKGPEPRPTSAHPRLHDKHIESGYIVTKADLRRKRAPDDVSDRVRQIYADVGRVARKPVAKRDDGGLHEAILALKYELRQEQDRRLKVAARNRRLEEVIAMKDKKLEDALSLRSTHGPHQMQREMAAKERTHHHLLGKLREKLQQATTTIAAYEDTLNSLRSSVKHTHVMELNERLAQYEMELDLATSRLEAQDKTLDHYRKQMEDRSETAAQKTIKRLRTVVLSLNDEKKRLEHENRVLKECLATERTQRRSPKKPKPPPKAIVADVPTSPSKERSNSQSLRREIDGKLAAKRPPSAGAGRRLVATMAGGAVVQENLTSVLARNRCQQRHR